MIPIRGYSVDVDIARELSKYEWERVRWTADKFQACSPFRRERRPSFAVHLQTGAWIDSGTDVEDWKRGNFVKLLAWLQNASYTEAEDYLLGEYHAAFVDVDSLRLDLSLTLESQLTPPLPRETMRPYWFRHPYLQRERGIDEATQRLFSVGYDRERKAVAFPWFDKDGQLINIKFRSIRGKQFWYYPAGQPIKHHLYGLHLVHQERAERVFIVESEIDCLTLWQYGFPALAMGGANLTATQRDLLLRSPVQTLVLATDNDSVGRAIAHSITSHVNGYMRIEQMPFPANVKDVNDLSVDQLRETAQKTTPVPFTFPA